MTGLVRGEPVAPVKSGGELHREISGRDVLLRRPVPEVDTRSSFAATHGSPEREAVWTYMGYGPWANEESMRSWVVGTLPSRDPFWWVIEAAGTPVGMATVMNRDDTNRRAEVGHIWYTPSAQRTTVNTEAAYLMIRECFDILGCRRAEWKCDALNERSRCGGASRLRVRRRVPSSHDREGPQPRHGLVCDDRRRLERSAVAAGALALRVPPAPPVARRDPSPTSGEKRKARSMQPAAPSDRI